MIRKIIPLLLVSMFAAGRVADAAIAHDADAGSRVGAGSSSLTWSHTCTGSNLILWVAVGTGNNSPSVTYNGVSLTQVGTTNQSGYYTYLFVLVAPATGTHNVVVTLGSGTNVIFGNSSSYTGAKQSGVPDASNTGTDTGGTGSPLTIGVTTVADSAWTVASFVNSSGAAPSSGTGATIRDEQHDSGAMSTALYDSNGAVSPAGSRSMAMNAANNSTYKAGVMASFAPATPPGTPTTPSPADTATNQTTSFTTGCSASGSPTSWSILGPDTTNPPTTNHTGLTNCDEVVSGLSNGTTYYWRATATNAAGSTQGPVWSFTTVSSGSTITVSDVSWLGMYRVASHGNCYSGTSQGGHLAVRYVSGARHFLVGQENNLSGNTRYTPCEFLDTATYDSDGDCTANCPNQTLGSSPQLAFIGNWGFATGQVSGTAYDFWHGVLGKCYGSGSACDDAGSTALNDCTFYGGGGCQITNFFIVPGSPDRLFFMWGSLYGAYHQFNLGFCELTTMPVAANNTSPVSNCYGPFNSESALRQIPTQTSTDNYKGLRSAHYMLKLPDGSYAWGGDGSGASYQQGFGPAGPTLLGIDALPTTSTTAGPAGSTITASTKYLGYYNMACANPPSCTTPALNYDGSVPGGQAIWAFRFPNYPYLWSGFPCAANVSNPAGLPTGCTGGTGYTDDGDRMMIDPRQNSGIGTWGDTFSSSGCAWVSLSTREGILCFGSGGVNHLAGNITTCSHALNWYCSGQSAGATGNTCSGPNDLAFGHPGDLKDPKYSCTCTDCATGPSTNMKEAFILVFNPDDALDVAAGSTVDYTVDAASIIYPQADISSSILLAPYGTIGVSTSFGDVVHDPNNPHIIYVAAPAADNATYPGAYDMVIHVFKIAG